MNVLSTKDFTREWVEEIINGARTQHFPIAASRARARAHSQGNPLPRKIVLLFIEPSTRTLGSFSEAARLLSADCEKIVSADATSLVKGESYANTARMLGSENQGADVLIMRTKIEGAPRFTAEILKEAGHKTAVINAGDGTNQHPTQALLDWLTISEFLAKTSDFTFGIVGDLAASRVAHSDLGMARLMGVRKVRLVSAPEAKIQPRCLRGFEEVVEGDSLEVLSDCDVVVVLRVQEERYTDPVALQRIKGRFRINQAVLDGFKSGVIVMHPLPCIDEVDQAVYADPRWVAFKQAEFGVPVRMATIRDSGAKLEVPVKVQTDPSDYVIPYEILKKPATGASVKKKGREFQYFRPITRGLIIDHIPQGQGALVRRLFDKVRQDKNTVLHLVEGVPSQKCQSRKDVFIVEGSVPNDGFMAVICFLMPELTVNIICEGTHQKVMAGLPKILKGILVCPNPNCVTNNDPEAGARTRFLKTEIDGALMCHYCEREFSRGELLATLRGRAS